MRGDNLLPRRTVLVSRVRRKGGSDSVETRVNGGRTVSVEHDEEFTAFVERTSPRLLTAAWMLTGDPGASQDVVHEALVRVYLRWPRLRGADPTAYARRVVVKLHTDRYRSRRPEVLTDGVLTDDVPLTPREHEARPVDLTKALRGLSAREREVVVVRHYLDQSERDTAEALGARVGAVQTTGSCGLAKLRAALDGDETPVVTDRDVIDLMDQAAMDPPPMRLAVTEVLSKGQARRRIRRMRQVGMALAAVVIAAVAWVGLGPSIDGALSEDATPVERVEWDSTVDFEADLNVEPIFTRPGFQGATVRRPAGLSEFTVHLQGAEPEVILEPVAGDLPPGVSLFVRGGMTLMVSEELYDAPSVVDLSWPQSGAGGSGVKVTDASAAIHVWVMDAPVEPVQVRDIYWQLPEQTVTSQGESVISESVEVDGQEVSIMVVESTGRWARRLSDESFGVFTAGDPDAVAMAGDGIVTVLPADARSPQFEVSGPLPAGGGGFEERERRLTPSVRFVGDYQLVWAALDDSDFVDIPFAVIDYDGAPTPAFEGPAEVETAVSEDGSVVVSAVGAAATVPKASADGFAATSRGPDGSGLVVVSRPTDLGGEDDPPGVRGLDAEPVFIAGDRLVTAYELDLWNTETTDVPGRPDLVAVQVQRGIPDRGVEIVPTVLFHTDAGLRWAGQPPPARHELDDGARITVSIDAGIGAWAAESDHAGHGLGRIGTTQVAYLESVDRGDEPATPTLYYAVLVLPSDVASSAVPIINRPGIDLDRVIVGEPVTVDIGDGLSLWAVSLNRPPGGTLDGLEEALVGVDLDGDGVAD
ncbi:hypothetical protein BH23ACT6_BH23ACT6_17110 [soil metagenome]